MINNNNNNDNIVIINRWNKREKRRGDFYFVRRRPSEDLKIFSKNKEIKRKQRKGDNNFSCLLGKGFLELEGIGNNFVGNVKENLKTGII